MSSAAHAGAGAATLAIETSQRAGTVALRAAPGADIVQRIVEPPSDARDPLLPAIDALVRAAGLRPADLGLIAVSVGPGGFTGLRIAVATAKSMALATGARVVAVPSALVVAHAVAGDAARASDPPSGPVAVVLASKGESAWMEVIAFDQAPHASPMPHRQLHGLFTVESAPLNGVRVVIADQHLPPSWAQYIERQGIARMSAAWFARSCLIVGEEIVRAQGPTDPLVLAPIYPRQPEAVTLWEGRSGRAATPH